MPNEAPMISVIIPAYNEEKFIKACLNSLLMQNLPKDEYEIVVVDNASTDKTSKIVRNFPVKLAHEKRHSVVFARQKAVELSKGELIVSGDADTLYPPNWLSEIRNEFNNDKNTIALVGFIYFQNSPLLFDLSFALGQTINFYLYKIFGRFPLVFAANFAFKKSALEKIGGYPKHLPELGDQQYLLYKFIKLGKVKVCPSIKCFTSSRRHRSVRQNIKLNVWYRLFGFALNSITGKQIIGPAPAYRKGN